MGKALEKALIRTNKNLNLILPLIRRGFPIETLFKELKINPGTFYKYLTEEQSASIRDARSFKTRSLQKNVDRKIVIIRREDRINYIIDGVCEYFNIGREQLMCKANTAIRYNRKRITIKMLKDVADCSFKDIKYVFNNKSEANIWYIYDSYNLDLRGDTAMGRAAKKEYDNVLKYMNL